jgi:pectinesterase inhibitor-like protein
VAVVVLVIIFTIVPSFPTTVVADANFIAQVCKKTKEANGDCVEVLSADPRSFNATSMRELVSLDIATSATSDVAKGIDDEAAKHDERSPLGEALIDCAGYYGQAEQPLEDARESFDRGARTGKRSSMPWRRRTPGTGASGPSLIGSSPPSSPCSTRG